LLKDKHIGELQNQTEEKRAKILSLYQRTIKSLKIILCLFPVILIMISILYWLFDQANVLWMMLSGPS